MNFIGSKVIETERLLLRPTEESDLKTLWEILCIPDVHKYYLTCKMNFDWEKEKVWQYKKLERAKNPDVFQWSIVLKETKECIGQISVHEARLEDDAINDFSIRGIGWFINPPYQRKGYATECAKEILKYMFEEVGICEIKTGAAIKNLASWKLMEKLGFQRRNKNYQVKYTFLEELEELYLYGMTKEEYKKYYG